jgi:hypothetical protein
MTKKILDFEAKSILKADFTREGIDPQSQEVAALGIHSVTVTVAIAAVSISPTMILVAKKN